MKTYPLLQSQLSIYRAWLSRPDEVDCNLPTCITLDATVDIDRLHRAVEEIVATRSVLHTQLGHDELGNPCQWSDPSLPVPVERFKMTDDEAQHFIHHEFVQPFATEGQALCRFAIIEATTVRFLLMDLHHIIADGVTIAHLFIGRDLAAAYAGKALAPDYPLGKWGEAECQARDSEAYHRARTRHHEQLGQTAFTRLPLLHGQNDHRATYGHATIDLAAVKNVCSTYGTSVNTWLMTAFAIVVAKVTHRRQVAFFALTHGRHRDQREAYGMFVQSLPVVIEMDDTATPDGLAHRLATQLTTEMRHSIHSATELCHELGIAPTVTFGYQGPSIEEAQSIDGHHFTGRQLPSPTSHHELCCTVYEHATTLEVRLESDYGHLDETMLHGIAHGMTTLLQQMQTDPHQPVCHLSMTSTEDMATLLQIGRGTQTNDNDTETWLDLFDLQVRLTPDCVAVDDGQQTMTYRELDQQSRHVAALLSHKAAASPFVAVATERCCAFVAAVVGCWRTGKGYMPLDTSLPATRKNELLAHCGSEVLLDRNTTLPDEECPLSTTAMGQTPAYLMYTSGSSGTPKGVVVSHRALLNLVRHVVRHWPVTATSRIACHSSLAFDGSVEDLFPVLTVGGTLCIVPDKVRLDLDLLATWLRHKGITGGCMTTRMGVQLLQRHPNLPMDYVCLGGEVLSAVPQCRPRVLNTYGPTEFTVNATWCEVRHDDRIITIGRPLDNNLAAVVDLHGQLLPHGLTGELWLAGPQMADGYWRDDELTDSIFVHSDELRCKAYHTGDLVRWNNDGQLEFVGRADRQIKWHGYRIEPGEVEAALCRHEGVSDAVVTLHDDSLCAHYVATDSVSPTALQGALLRQLPHYMVPTLWCRVERLPIGTHDKMALDRLPQPHRLSSHHVAPTTATQRLWCDIFTEVLGQGPTGIDDDFFAIGGTSLTVVDLVDTARRHGLSVNYGTVFDHPTPRQLAALPNDGRQRAVAPSVSRLATAVHHPLERCLVTGATGFLGTHIVKQLLDSTDADVWCLVREPSRLAEVWQYYFDEALPDRRIHIVKGDLTNDGWQELLSPVDQVIHCAANVNQYAPEGQLEQVNVGGTRRMADWCSKHGARLVHISTRSVAGLWPDGMAQPPFDEYSLDIGQTLPNDYVATKFAAECDVLSRVGDGRLDALVLRVGNLTPRSSDGRFQINASDNAFASALRLFQSIGKYPQSLSDVPIDLSPIDLTAHAIVLLAGATTDAVVLHPFDGKRRTVGELMDAMGLAPCDDDEVAQALSSQPDSSVVRALWPTDRHLRPVKCDNTLTTRLLSHLGFDWEG